MKIPHIKNAFKNIKKACDEKILKLYPMGIPTDISSRYEQELTYLEDSEYLDDFEIFRLLSKEALKCSTIISMRGTEMGSFIYYLLGNNCFNPLPVHYYCRECGHYEAVHTHLFGIDLPEKTCPKCKASIFADGFNLHSESVWGNYGKKMMSFEYNISAEFLPFARRVLESLYPNNDIIPWGIFEHNSDIQEDYSNSSAIGVGLSGYVILPTGNTIHDYPDLISYLENGDSCISGSRWELETTFFIKPIRLSSLCYIETLLKLQRTTGIYANEITQKDLHDITWSNIFNTTILNKVTGNLFHEFKPKTYRDMISFESSSHSTFLWQKTNPRDWYQYKNMLSSESFKKYPCFTREDFFDHLIEAGVDRKTAFTASDRIRKGHANSAKFRDEFDALSIPEEIKEVARYYLYTFPRAHCIEYMLIFARIAYYARMDSKSFSKIMFKKKS